MTELIEGKRYRVTFEGELKDISSVFGFAFEFAPFPLFRFVRFTETTLSQAKIEELPND